MAEISGPWPGPHSWNMAISSPSEPGPSPDNNDIDDERYEHHHQPPPFPGGDARESTELARLRRNYTLASSLHAPAPSTLSKPTTLLGRFTYAAKKFWNQQVSVTVPHQSCRDHLALERTFLGYLRTSLLLSVTGVLVSQLYHLQHSPTPNHVFGFYVLGKPLACICHGAALGTISLGAFKTWRSQNAIVRGKALAGGFEVILVGAGVFLVLITFFVLVVAVDIKKEY